MDVSFETKNKRFEVILFIYLFKIYLLLRYAFVS